MANLTVNNQLSGAATCIPNDFIDTYMPQANGEYVKIYLYLLRLSNRQDTQLSISRIADHFEHTEKDVSRALAYWEKQNLLKLEYDTKNTLTGICILNTSKQPDTSAEAKASSDTLDSIRALSVPKRKIPTRDQLTTFCEREEVQELIFLTETYLSRTISRSDLDCIFAWYDQLHFSIELIEYLIETCITKGHTSLRYMQKVAEDWYAQNIQTPEQAKLLVSRNNEAYYTILKAFGIRGRNLIPAEMEFLKKWSSFGFSKEIIEEACRRTIQNIHEPSFEYADSILTSWNNRGLHSMEEIQQADAAYAKQQAANKANAAPRPTKKNQFNNFQQRDYDYDELERQLLEKSMQ